MSTIVAAVDFSAATERVARTAKGLSDALGGALLLIHVEAPDPAFVGYEPGPQHVRDALAKEIMEDHRALHDLADTLRGEGCEVTALVVKGPTAEKILEEARRSEAAYIVVGSHGHGALYDLLVGSVSDAVIRGADRPVVVVPASQRP